MEKFIASHSILSNALSYLFLCVAPRLCARFIHSINLSYQMHTIGEAVNRHARNSSDQSGIGNDIFEIRTTFNAITFPIIFNFKFFFLFFFRLRFCTVFIALELYFDKIVPLFIMKSCVVLLLFAFINLNPFLDTILSLFEHFVSSHYNHSVIALVMGRPCMCFVVKCVRVLHSPLPTIINWRALKGDCIGVTKSIYSTAQCVLSLAHFFIELRQKSIGIDRLERKIRQNYNLFVHHLSFPLSCRYIACNRWVPFYCLYIAFTMVCEHETSYWTDEFQYMPVYE